MAAGPAAAGLLLTWGAPLQFAIHSCSPASAVAWVEDGDCWAGWLAWEVLLSWVTVIFAGPSWYKAAGSLHLSTLLPRICCLDHKQTAISENLPKKKLRS